MDNFPSPQSFHFFRVVLLHRVKDNELSPCLLPHCILAHNCNPHFTFPILTLCHVRLAKSSFAWSLKLEIEIVD